LAKVPPKSHANVARAADAPAPSAGVPGFDDVYGRFARVVHGIALAHVGRDDAEDVVQEVFTRVFEELGAVRDAAALPKWVCTIARNSAIDCMRRRRRRPKPDTELIAMNEAPEPQRTDDGLALAVLDIVRSLPVAYRETLVLRLVEGLSGPEIAARTGLTHGSVRVNLNRGMNLLRPLLARAGWQ
jgi:RNA polymerase sigma-70 factor (ECF subfamily)